MWMGNQRRPSPEISRIFRRKRGFGRQKSWMRRESAVSKTMRQLRRVSGGLGPAAAAAVPVVAAVGSPAIVGRSGVRLAFKDLKLSLGEKNKDPKFFLYTQDYGPWAWA